MGPTTSAPTKSPTDKPSTSPILSPTNAPSDAPTTDAPTTPDQTPSPTQSPVTDTPTQSPVEPTQSPEAVTPTPSSAIPTDPPATDDVQGPITTTDLTMTLSGISSIEDNYDWEATTGKYFMDVYDTGDLGLYDTGVTITIDSAKSGTGRRLRSNTRSLQEPSVVVTYTQEMYYRSSNQDLTNNEIFTYPLSTDTLRDRYVYDLKQLDGYEDLAAVSAISISNDPDPGTGGNENAGGLSMGAIIGIACGGAALLILIVGFVYKRQKSKESEFVSNNQGGPGSSTQDMGTGSGMGTGSSIPTYGDQSVATVDYDYSRAYGGAGAHSLSDAGGTLGSRTRQTAAETSPGMGGGGNTIFSDDATFDQAYENMREECIDIYAPQGKLGVVIDTPNDGAPVVHAVKDTSPISNKVQVGDKLVAVDDEDVRAMTAIKVSKLISRKSNNASRKLTIIRMVPN